MKKWIWIVLLLTGGGAGLYYWPVWKARALQRQLESAPKTAVVEARDIEFAISAAGDIGPADQVSVRPEINGRIETLNVDIGDKVTGGQVLFTLNDKDLQTERASRVTEIDGARLQVERAERNYQRAQQLFKEKLISQELYEDTQTDFELAKNALDRAQKALAQVEERLTKTKIVAPFDCTILTRPVSIGQAVSGSGGFNSGTEVLTIANLNEMIINAHINQADITRLRTGQEVAIEVEAIPGSSLRGTIERLAPQATIKNGIKGFAARILLRNVDERVRPGMTANLSIPIASASNVLAVPLSAVFTEQGERYVYVKNGNRYERQNVQIGVADFFYAEVQSGLAAGQSVALEPPPGFADQQATASPTNGMQRSRLAIAGPAAPSPALNRTNLPAVGALAGSSGTNTGGATGAPRVQ